MKKNRLIKIFVVFVLLIYLLNYNCFAGNFLYKTINKKTLNEVEASISTGTTAPAFNFESVSQILIEPTTGEIIYANNENEKLYPASVTKIMTLLLLMEKIDSGAISYEDKLTCSANASKMGGSQIWFKEGEILTIDEALKAICVVSANDVTVAVAEMLGGSEENFVQMMNKKAEELKMTNTHFMNSHGIDEDNHYTTAYDIALMSMELINKHPNILKYTSIWMDTLRNGTFSLSSTNKLIRYYEGATGLKTGSTSKALFNLSATATRKNTTMLAVVMKAPSSEARLNDVKQLLDFGFATYETKEIVTKDVLVEQINVNKNIHSKVNVYVKDFVTTLCKKGSNINTLENVIYKDNITAPLKNGDIVGKIEIINSDTNEIIGSSDLIIKEDVEKSDFFEYLKKTFNVYILKNN